MVKNLQKDLLLKQIFFLFLLSCFSTAKADSTSISSNPAAAINSESIIQKVYPSKEYIGAGLTGFGLIPCRLDDSMGAGAALSWLNQKTFDRVTETIYQTYYQALLFKKNIYLEPALSYVPTPGESKNISAGWAGTLRLIVLF